MSLSTKVLLGLVLGIGVGVFFGESAASLKIVGDAFIQLLQMTVLPYILVALVAGLGRLDFRDARRIALRGGAVLLIFWSITLTVVALFPLAFPDFEAGSFFSTSLVEERAPIDFLGIYIPSNPFYSLGHSLVPGVVFFGVAMGVALIGVEGKRGLIEQLTVLSDALMRVTSFVVSLAPYGVFAIAANAAGTMGVEELQRLQVYVVAYSAAALLLTFWILPGLVTSLTPLRYRGVVGRTRDALVTAFATGNLLIVLPLLAQRSKALLMDHLEEVEEVESVADVLVPTSFNFPSAGKLLTLAFVPFAAWFVGSSISPASYPGFLLAGTLSFFGQTVMAVPFLLDLEELPADLFQLFVTVDVITGRFGVLLAAMHTACLALLGTAAITGSLVFTWNRLLRFAVVSVGLTLAILLSVRVLFGYALDLGSTSYRIFVEMDLCDPPVPATVHTSPMESLGPISEPRAPRLGEIQERGSLRVGYLRDNLPFAFVNAAGNLVGFGIEMAHALARDREVRIDFVRVERGEVAQCLTSGLCDIVMSGVALTPERTREVAFSVPYMEGSLGFIVPDHRRDEFTTWEDVRRLGAPRIGVPDAPYYVALVREHLPEAKLVPHASPRAFFAGAAGELDAFVYGAEAGSAWTLVYPRYAVVVPLPNPIAVPLAYPMPRGQGEMVDFVNTWLELKRGDNTIEDLYEHWILGRATGRKGPRWSVIRDVLGWVD
jgi:Na+/H+-dicarboxylate symporter